MRGLSKKEKNLMDMDNCVVIVGRWEGDGVEEGIVGIKW